MRNDFVSLDRPDPLTDRETEILRLMASGFSNKEIANSLGVAEGTIKNHVSNILSKLGFRDRTRAVLKAFELQLEIGRAQVCTPVTHAHIVCRLLLHTKNHI